MVRKLSQVRLSTQSTHTCIHVRHKTPRLKPGPRIFSKNDEHCGQHISMAHNLNLKICWKDFSHSPRPCHIIQIYITIWVFFFMLSWMFQHDYLDTYCFECLICMCFAFLYLLLFSAIEHVSHGMALEKYAHYYYNTFIFQAWGGYEMQWPKSNTLRWQHSHKQFTSHRDVQKHWQSFLLETNGNPFS